MVKRIRLPKVPTHKPVYAKKLCVEAWNIIHQIHIETDFPKWRIIEQLICNALKISTLHPLDLKKWVKK